MQDCSTALLRLSLQVLGLLKFAEHLEPWGKHWMQSMASDTTGQSCWRMRRLSSVILMPPKSSCAPLTNHCPSCPAGHLETHVTCPFHIFGSARRPPQPPFSSIRECVLATAALLCHPTLRRLRRFLASGWCKNMCVRVHQAQLKSQVCSDCCDAFGSKKVAKNRMPECSPPYSLQRGRR